MKQSKKLTRRQKILLDRMRIVADDYRVLVEGKSAILIENKHNGQVLRKIIPEGLRGDAK